MLPANFTSIVFFSTVIKSNDANPQPARPTTPPRPRYCDPSLSLLERVCTEIVDTENVYVEDLRQVVEVSIYDLVIINPFHS